MTETRLNPRLLATTAYIYFMTGGGTLDLQLLARQMEMYSSILTPSLIFMGFVAAFFFAYRFLRNYERNQELSREELRMQRDQLEFARVMPPSNSNYGQTSITIAGDPSAPGGYDFVQVPDEFKSIFLEAMSGFRDYAKLRGYTIDLSVDASLTGKVGLRITIVDVGVTVSTATVRKDVDDYLRKFKDGDDFDDMPMPENSAEAMLLKTALKMRFAHLQSQMEIHKFKNDLLLQMVNDVKATGLSAVGYPAPQTQSLHLTLQNDGGKNMRDSFEANNSQNIAQGKGASAYTSDSNIQIGNTHVERNQRIDALKDFLGEVEASDLPKTIKGEVVRYIENAKEEMETAEQPDPDQVGKWLDRADKTIKTADAGAGLLEKLGDLLTVFGMS